MTFPMHVEPVKDEGDMVRCMEIYHAAFNFVPIHLLSHGANTAENHLRSARIQLRGQREHNAEFPSVPVCIKCVATDPATGQAKTVGYAEWHVYDRPRTDEEVMKLGYSMWYEWVEDEADKETCQSFVRSGIEKRRGYLGTQPYGMLKFMCVDPEHRRQGVGSLVVKWGMDRCAELGIPAYLETSPEGMALYRGLGFELMGTEEQRKGFLYPGMIWWPPASNRPEGAMRS